jgi:hypothetical protein
MKGETMSAQEMQLPGITVGRPAVRRFSFAVLIAVALVAGGFVGRSTAPTDRVQADVRPATALSGLGVSSIGDARRAEMHAAMNGILAGVARAPATRLDPKSVVSPESRRRARMYRAMNGLSPQ